MERYGNKKCDHFWVRRLDGWEEQCIPTICSKCGAFGCFCDYLQEYRKNHRRPFWTNRELTKATELFEKRLGLKSTDDNGTWMNPYLELKKGDLRELLII